MTKYAPKLPLRFDSTGGYSTIDNLKDVIRQNFKNLLLTAPGERVMDINFGCGLKNLLFENDTIATRNNAIAKVRQQVSIYMPYINILSIKFISSLENPLLDENTINAKIYYFIAPLESDDVLSVNV